MDPSIDFSQVFGRLHPVLVHFPIALLMLAGVLELFRRKDRPSNTAMTCVAVGALGAVLTAWAGWEFAEYDGPGPSRTMWLHRWGGISVASLSVLCVLFGIAARRGTQPRASSLFRGGVIVCMLLVGFVAHQGGKSVWGEDFVFELLEKKLPVSEPMEDPAEPPVTEATPAPVAVVEGGPVKADVDPSTGSDVPGTPLAPADSTPAADPAPAGVDYATRIQPIFAASCYECHGPKRRPKGGLRLSDMPDVFAGPQEIWVIQPGDAAASLLYERITLPTDHEDFMPAKGDPLTADQVALIRDWIDHGAKWTEVPAKPEDDPAEGPDEEVGARARDSGEPAKNEPVRTASLESPEPLVLDEAQRAARDAALDLLGERGAYASRIASSTDEVEVNLGLLSEPAGDDSLELLKGLEPCLASLDLSRTKVTSAGLARLGAFQGLRRLRLDRTAIDDAGLRHVAGLSALEYLNLVGTPVTDAGIAALDQLHGLRKLFLWQTEVTDAGVAALSRALPDLAVVRDTYTPLVIEEVDTAAAPSAPCCDAAAAAGRACDHPCCVEAAARGEVCPKCSA